MPRWPAPLLAALTLAATTTATAFARPQDKPADPSEKDAPESGETARSRGLFDKVVKSVQKAGGDVSNAAKKAGGDISNTAKKAGGDLSTTVKKAGGDVSNAGKKAGSDVSSAAKRKGGEISDASHKLGGKVSSGYQKAASEGLRKLKASPLYRQFQERALSLFMEAPHVTRVNAHLPGHPVYYINGMLTRTSVALAEADALSAHLKRPVFLIRNPTFLEGSTGTPHCADDVSEAVYDKTWPERLAGVDLSDLLPRLSLPNPPIAQLDPTTRQITHLIYHADHPVSIVSHSQGCLMVRNAILAAALLGKERAVEHGVAWVATGTPVNDKEIWPMPARYTYHINATDPVSALIGTRGGPGMSKSLQHSARDHEPIRNYFPRVKPSELFP